MSSCRAVENRTHASALALLLLRRLLVVILLLFDFGVVVVVRFLLFCGRGVCVVKVLVVLFVGDGLLLGGAARRVAASTLGGPFRRGSLCRTTLGVGL